MRRISVWMAVLVILFILVADAAGMELDRKEIDEASKLAASGQVRMEGRISEVTYVSDELFRILLESDGGERILYSVSGERQFSIYELPGRTAVIEGELKLPEAASNPGVFDYRQHLRSEGIYLVGECRVENVSVKGLDADPLKGILINKVSVLKDSYCRKMDEVWEGSAGLFAGMLFGDTSRMPDEVYESFRKNGTAHILSVSGLHVAVIYGAVNMLMGKRRNSLAAACFSAAALAGCALLASFSVSVMRAVTMISLHILSKKIHKRYDIISAACVTAVIFLIYRPYMLFNSGFILSFSAVTALAAVGGGMNRKIKNRGPVSKIIISIVSIQLGMLPINIYLFNYFSFASFISNIPVIFLSSFMIPLGMAGFLISMTGSGIEILFEITASVGGVLGEMMIFFNDLTGAYGRLCLPMESPSVSLCAAYYILLFFFFSEHAYLHPLNGRGFGALIMVILVLTVSAYGEERMKPEVVFVDVGQGDCIHIRTPSGKDYLVDGGGSLFADYDVGEKAVLPYLLKNGVGSLEGVFVSHMDADHYKGLSYINGVVDTGKVYLYEGYKESEAEAAFRLNKDREDICYIKKGSTVYLDKEVSISVIFPERVEPIELRNESEGNGYTREEPDLNELSAVMMLDYKGTRILLTGDIGEEEEQNIKEDLSCDIVKVPHHGSGYSSCMEFVAGTDALAAVIQVGNNYFGHPDESVIERYRKKGIIVFRNDEDGAVLVDIDPGGFRIRGVKGGKRYEF